MCRLTAYLGPPAVPADLVTRPNRSMITQSYAARERQQGIGYLNGDGFGLGWYPQDIPDSHPDRLPGEPCAFTDQGPAWNNRNLAHLARSIISPLVFVHIRAATPGLAVCSCSCHPFTYGRMMWMHNGCIGNFRDVRRELLASLGDRAHSFAVDKGASDSALCFAIFLDEIADPFAILELNEMRRAVESVIHRIEAACIKQKCTVTNLLNFVVSDGHSIIATRYIWRPSPDNHDKAATMYFGSGTGYECRNPETGEYRMVHKDRRERLAVITSEPLTTDQTDWVSVPENHILIVSHDVHMLLSEIGPPMETNRCLVESLKCLRFEQLTRDMLPAPSANFEESMVGDTVFEDPCVHTMFGHEDTILSLASSDGLLFSGSQDATIRAWDIEHFHCAHVLKGHTGSIFSLAVHDGVLLSASSDNTVRRWDVKETFECLTIVQFYGMGDILSMSIVGSRLFLGFQVSLSTWLLEYSCSVTLAFMHFRRTRKFDACRSNASPGKALPAHRTSSSASRWPRSSRAANASPSLALPQSCVAPRCIAATSTPWSGATRTSSAARVMALSSCGIPTRASAFRRCAVTVAPCLPSRAPPTAKRSSQARETARCASGMLRQSATSAASRLTHRRFCPL
eukprot:m.130738 g.130738  ORF g.130738 m.130738 type:complete len:627 (-) comp9793_c1_seq3:3594-5474(-)